MALADVFLLCISCLLIGSGNGLTNGNGVAHAWVDRARYMASLRTIADEKKHICAGNVYLYNQWIITARSCLLDPEVKAQTMVVYPIYSRELKEINKGRSYHMDKSFCHPLLKDKPDVHTDIGLIKLKEPIQCSECERTKLLREDFHGHYNNDDIYVAGWGKIRETDSEMSNFLKRVFYGIEPAFGCQRDLKSYNFVHPNHICLRNPQDYSVAPCFGDEGGPAFMISRPFYYELQGIIPAIPGTCNWSPFVMNISHFREFIDDVVRHEPPEYECVNLSRPS